MKREEEEEEDEREEEEEEDETGRTKDWMIPLYTIFKRLFLGERRKTERNTFPKMAAMKKERWRTT